VKTLFKVSMWAIFDQFQSCCYKTHLTSEQCMQKMMV